MLDGTGTTSYNYDAASRLVFVHPALLITIETDPILADARSINYIRSTPECFRRIDRRSSTSKETSAAELMISLSMVSGITPTAMRRFPPPLR